MRGGASGIVLLILVLAGVAAGVWYGFFRDSRSDAVDVALTPPLTRGPMRVTISESGSLESLDSFSVTNKVEGRSTIDYIIPEGTVITEEDVRNKKVLVELNTADLVEKRIRQEIEVAAAEDAYKNAETNLEIQIHQNASDVRKAELDVHFAKLDLKRYVGQPFAQKLMMSYLDSMRREKAARTKAAAAANAGSGTPAPAGTDAPGPEQDDEGTGLASSGLRRLISSLLESEGLDGEALQRIRELSSDIHLAKEELGRAQEKKSQSERLLEKGYVSAEEFEADRLALKRREIAEEQAETARSQFVDYDFPKEVAKLLSQVVEAEDGVVRVKKRAAANEAQKRFALISKQKQKELKVRRLQSYLAQEKMSTIHATQPGLIVYASSGRERRWGNDDRIDVGASVREGQDLIKIPSPRSLGARISVHETFIDRVEEGQDAWITVDAMPGVRIPAQVKSVARLPNPADRWLNPDLKVYTTILEFKDEQRALKPGMSAEVEILIAELEDVLAAPVQAVAGTVEEPAVYVWTDAGAERRPVKLGLASEHFVEIREGVQPGERLLLDPPREAMAAPAGETGKPAGEGAAKKGTRGRPAGASNRGGARKGRGGEKGPAGSKGGARKNGREAASRPDAAAKGRADAR